MLPIAKRELAAAISWYEEQCEGLGVEFLRAMESLMVGLRRLPERYPIVARRTRRARLPRFPYALLFVVEQGRILITAVLHGSRDPVRWSDRIQEPKAAYEALV